MQKKAFDPRAKVANPFVQAYVEKQAQKTRPIGEAQSFVNVLLICGMVINFFVLLLVGWSRPPSIPTAGSRSPSGAGDNLPLADAVARIQQLEATFATMQSNVEFHKNAYYKLEGDYENMKAAMARIQNGNDSRVDLSAYPMPPAAMAALGESAGRSRGAFVNTNHSHSPYVDDEAPAIPREPVRLPLTRPKSVTQQYLIPRALDNDPARAHAESARHHAAGSSGGNCRFGHHGHGDFVGHGEFDDGQPGSRVNSWPLN